MKNLKAKSIIITGAAMGLGLAAAEELASQEAYLTLVDFNEKSLSEAARKISKAYPNAKVTTVVGDASKEDDVKKYVAAAVKAYGRIDGLYNNAGIEGRQAPMTEYDMDVFKKVIDINLMGVYYTMRHVIPVMQKQKYGRIVNVASVGGIRGVLNQVPYVASKHAVSGMTKNAALEYGRDGITTTAIAPGAILTPMVAEAFAQVNPADPKKGLLTFLGIWYAKIGLIGGLLTFGMSLVTLSFLMTTPEVYVPNLGGDFPTPQFGFPYLSGAGRLVLKDVIMMGAGLICASDSARRLSGQRN